MSSLSALLPCPFCGCNPCVAYEVRAVAKWLIQCPLCLASSRSTAANGGGVFVSAWDHWNTRYIDGHKVTFHYEEPGVIGEDSCWVVFSGGYMYGPCSKWQDVERLIREEWEWDRNLVG